MEKNKVSTRVHWLQFIFWLVVIVLLMVFLRQYFWLALPGLCTSFAKGMNIM